jgi:type I restriction enzyme S subunit
MRPYLRVANVYEDRIDTSDVLEMNFEPKEYAIYALRDGDILLNEGQSPDLVGRPAKYRDEVPGSCFQNTLIRFRSGRLVDPDFALLVFRYYLHAGVFRRIARWSTNIAHLGLERFRALALPLPPIEEQTLIAAEARNRLETASAQGEAIQASLARLPEMEGELLAAAVGGELTPQDPADESAEALLDRLGPPPDVPRSHTQDQIKEAKVVTTKPRFSSQHLSPTPDLAAVLREAGRPLPLPELFGQAGYDRDQPEHVELFYLALRG